MKLPARPEDMMYAIDFGTTNSLCAAATARDLFAPVPLEPGAQDESVLRSVLFFPSMHRCFFGTAGISEFVRAGGVGRLIRSIKKQLPVRSFIGTWIDDRPMNLEDIIGLFLKEVRERANRHFGMDVQQVVLGRPAKFSLNPLDDQFAQRRLEDSARRAGFKRIEFCPEPVAAAYEFRQALTTKKTILVADFGGGTSDFTVVRLGKEAFHDGDVMSIGGVAVAGDALEGALMRQKISNHFGADVEYRVPFGTNILRMPAHLMEKICSPADLSLLMKRDIFEFLRRVESWALGPRDREKMERLFCLVEEQLGFDVFEKIERTKRTLSDSDNAIFDYDHPVIKIRESVSRVEFEEATAETIAKIEAALDETLKLAGLTPAQIDLVCCTGGTAKVPAVQKALARRFGAEKLQDHDFFHSVVLGLSHRAQQLLAEA